LRDGLIKTYDELKIKPSEYIFQQDNAPCHTSGGTMEWLRTNNIATLKWPTNSPDLNIIENVWNQLEKNVRARSVTFDNEDQLWEILKEEWGNLDKIYISDLYFSMCARIKAVIKARGHNTKY
jgi:hypothetical protein